MTSSGSLTSKHFFLLAIAGAIAVAYLTAIARMGNSHLLFFCSLIAWFGVWLLLASKWRTLKLSSNSSSSFFGSLLIFLVMLNLLMPKPPILARMDFLSSSPFVSALGLALLASGFSGLKQYWREFIILAFPALSPLPSRLPVDPSPLTAQFAATLLWYMGYPVFYQDVSIYLPPGGVKVYPFCAGFGTIAQVLQLAILILFLMPLPGWQQVLLPVAAVAIGFCVNGARIALTVVLSNSGQTESFEYWHEGNGSLIFSAIAVLIFGLFFLCLPQRCELRDLSDSETELKE